MLVLPKLSGLVGCTGGRCERKEGRRYPGFCVRAWWEPLLGAAGGGFEQVCLGCFQLSRRTRAGVDQLREVGFPLLRLKFRGCCPVVPPELVQGTPPTTQESLPAPRPSPALGDHPSF